MKEIVNSKESFIEKFFHIIYKTIGVKLLFKKSFNNFFYKNIYNKRYEKILKQAEIKLIPEEYFISVFFILIFSLILFFIISFAFVFISFEISEYFFYGSIVALLILGILLYDYPISIANTRKKNIDAGLVYVLPYMKILSKELSLQRIIEIIPDFIIYEDIYREFERINYYYKFLGYDIHSSIKMAMESCPSKKLNDLFNDLVSISNSGGSIYNYLATKLENLNMEIIAVEKKLVDTLLIFSQVYVVLLLISPLFFAIMVSILDFVQISSITKGSAVALLFKMIFFLPFGYLLFIIFVYYSKPLYKRLTNFRKREKWNAKIF